MSLAIKQIFNGKLFKSLNKDYRDWILLIILTEHCWVKYYIFKRENIFSLRQVSEKISILKRLFCLNITSCLYFFIDIKYFLLRISFAMSLALHKKYFSQNIFCNESGSSQKIFSSEYSFSWHKRFSAKIFYCNELALQKNIFLRIFFSWHKKISAKNFVCNESGSSQKIFSSEYFFLDIKYFLIRISFAMRLALHKKYFLQNIFFLTSNIFC